MKLIIIGGIAIFLAFNIINAQTDNKSNHKANEESYSEVPKEIKDKCEDFFNKNIKNETESAYKNLLKDSPVNSNKENLNKLTEETARAIKIYGDMKSFEPISNEQVGHSTYKLKYLSLHKDIPLRWLFTFYKSPVLGWVVLNVKFDDQIDYLFRE
jgi:hypothetical protein